MDFKPLTKPMHGLYFSLFNVLFHINIAKSFLWASDTTEDNRTERTYQILTVCKSKHKEIGKLYRLIVGPFSFSIGVASK